jgi:hypothetical protein
MMKTFSLESEEGIGSHWHDEALFFRISGRDRSLIGMMKNFLSHPSLFTT